MNLADMTLNFKDFRAVLTWTGQAGTAQPAYKEGATIRRLPRCLGQRPTKASTVPPKGVLSRMNLVAPWLTILEFSFY